MTCKDVEGKGCGINWGTVPVLVWRQRGISQNVSGRISGTSEEI